MSIHNDYRQYGNDEEYAEWRRELLDEYRRDEAHDQEYYDRLDEYEEEGDEE